MLFRPGGGRMRIVIVDCAIYRDGRRTEKPADFSDALDECRADDVGDSFVWVGLHEPTEKEFEQVTREFGLHPLAVEDALKAHQRPKLEVYDDSLFMVLKPVGYEPNADIVSSGEIMVFIGDSFVVTVRHGEEAPLAAVRHRLEAEPEMLRHGPTAVLYTIADAVVDHYVEVADELGTDLEELEAEVFSPSDGARATRRRASTPSNGRSWSSAAPPARWRHHSADSRARASSAPACPSSTRRPSPSSGTSATTSRA